MPQTHEPGQARFRSILPEDIDWTPFPAFPSSARLAVLVGEPSLPGPYVIRVKLPSGVKLMPHRHPEDRIYTVMSGVFYIGLGEEFDSEKLNPYPPGSVVVLPGDTWHFHCAKSGEYVTQVSAIGPLGLEYLDPTTIRVCEIADADWRRGLPKCAPRADARNPMSAISRAHRALALRRKFRLSAFAASAAEPTGSDTDP